MTQNFHTPLATNAPALYSSLNTISSDLDAGITGVLDATYPFTVLSLGIRPVLTISSGVITPTKSFHAVGNEGAASTDDLVTINAGAVGETLILQAANEANVTVIKTTGNIRTMNGMNYHLTGKASAVFINDGTNWRLLNATQGQRVPLFEVSKTSNQTITQSIATKLTWQSEVEDVGGHFDVANDRFLPSLPGLYVFTGGALWNSATDGQFFTADVYKNGGVYIRYFLRAKGTASQTTPIIPTYLYLNGSTDYVELYVNHSGGAATVDINSAANATKFQGALIKGYKE